MSTLHVSVQSPNMHNVPVCTNCVQRILGDVRVRARQPTSLHADFETMQGRFYKATQAQTAAKHNKIKYQNKVTSQTNSQYKLWLESSSFCIAEKRIEQYFLL